MSYSNATTCTACEEDYYLDAGKCVKITIDDCDAALKDTAGVVQCTSCEDKKLVSANKCSDTDCTVANCERCV